MLQEFPSPREITKPATRWSGAFLAGVAAYFVFQIAARLAVSPSGHLDESEQVVLTQSLQWGYGPQPPLYTWLQSLVFAVTGPTLLGLSLLKNGILFGLFVASYRLGARLTGSERGGRMGALGLALMPDVIWEAQRDLTHSVLAALLSLVWLLMLLRLFEWGQIRNYVAAGVVLGLGCLSKYNFGIGAAAAALAALLVTDGRKVVGSPRFFLTLGIAGVIVTPHFWWATHHPALALASRGKLQMSAGWPPSLETLRTLLGALTLTLGSMLPPALVLGIATWGTPPPAPSPARSASLRWLVNYFLIAALLIFVGLTLFQVTTLRGRWFLPLWVAMPALLSGLMWPRLTASRERWVTRLGTGVAILVAILLPGRILLAERMKRIEPLHLPYLKLAPQLNPHVSAGTVVLADTPALAGNLRLAGLPAVCVSPETWDVLPHPTDRVLVVWDASRDERPSEQLAKFSRHLGLDERAEVQFAEAVCYYHSHRPFRLGYRTARPGALSAHAAP